MNDATIFDRLGGRIKLDEIVEDVYFRVLNDKRISRFFRNVNTVQLMQHQGIFLTILFSSREQLDDAVLDSLRKTHKSVGVTDVHFDLFISHLMASVRSLEVAPSMVQEITVVLAKLRTCFIATKRGQQQIEQPEVSKKKTSGSALRRFLSKAAAQQGVPCPADEERSSKMVEV